MYCQLPDIGLIKIRGNDAKKFLQGQLTCDVESITSEHSCMGAHCNPQGRIISLFYIFKFQEDYYLLMQLNMVAIALSALKKYAVFFKIEITDASQEWLAIGCQKVKINPTDIHNLARITLTDTRCIIAGEAAAIKTMYDSAIEFTTPESWQRLHIHDGIPTLYPETSSKFLPHEINLDKLNAISFEKGCYTGQEIIARMHYRGKLKNRMYQAEVVSETPPQRGADIYSMHNAEWKTGGSIVDACRDGLSNLYYVLIVASELDNGTGSLFLTKDLNTVLTVKL